MITITYTPHNKASVLELATEKCKRANELWEIEGNGVSHWKQDDVKSFAQVHLEYRVAQCIAQSKLKSATERYELAFKDWEQEGFPE